MKALSILLVFFLLSCDESRDHSNGVIIEKAFLHESIIIDRLWDAHYLCSSDPDNGNYKNYFSKQLAKTVLSSAHESNSYDCYSIFAKGKGLDWFNVDDPLGIKECFENPGYCFDINDMGIVRLAQKNSTEKYYVDSFLCEKRYLQYFKNGESYDCLGPILYDEFKTKCNEFGSSRNFVEID